MTGIQLIRDTLARHREHPSIGLDITFPIYWQMDADLGKIVGNDLGEHGSWEIMRATPSLGDRIPARTGLYMFVFRSHLSLALPNGATHRPTWVLYVGRAGSADSQRTLKDRYRGEYCKYVAGDPEQLWLADSDRTRASTLKKYLSIWPLEYWYLIVDDRAKVPLLEDRLIKLFSPPLNRLGRLRVATGEPKPAFKVPE